MSEANQEKTLSAETLGQIALIQSTVALLPDKESVFRFVCRGLTEVPGVSDVTHHLFYEAKGPEAPPGTPLESTKTVPVKIGNYIHGSLVFSVTDIDSFAPYIPFVENLANMLGVIFEERHQRQLNIQIMEDLEQKIYQRTKELEDEIIERKQAEQELRNSEAHLRTLVDTIPDLIWLKDKDGVYLSCNRIFERFLGAGQEDIKGKTDFHFFAKDLAEFFQKHDCQAIAAGGPTSNEEWVTFADDGRRAILETIKTPMYDGRGELIGVLGIGRDITKRRQAEEENLQLISQLQQSQKLESVALLAGGVAHDFNNMLGVILGHAEMLMEQVDASSPMYNDLEKIHLAAKRSSEITRKLLTFARKQKIEPKVIDINETIEGMLKMLRRLIGENIHLVWKPFSSLWRVKADPSVIDQILANLCVNARDAIAGIGQLTVETNNYTHDATDGKSPAESLPGNYVQIRVRDTGCGMDQPTLSHIFEPFFTTKGIGTGTGLGLATVYGAVKQHKGFIHVDSEPGQGTVFTIYLPRHTDQDEQVAPARAQVPAMRGQETILLVEDESAILEMARAMLQRLGYTVLTAASPAEALALVGSYPGEIQLLLTDVIMPEMNGRDLAERLKARQPGMQCLYMSGYTADIIAHQGVIYEGVNFIQKPFFQKDLAAKIREVIHLS